MSVDRSLGELRYAPDLTRPVRILSWAAYQSILDDLSDQARTWEPTAIVGILQGGFFVAQGLADLLGDVPALMMSIDADGTPRLVDSSDGLTRLEPLDPQSRILVVDEVVDSGRTLAAFRVRLEGLVANVAAGCLFAVEGRARVDFVARPFDELPEIVFPWRVYRDFALTARAILAEQTMTAYEFERRLMDLGFLSRHAIKRELRRLSDSNVILERDGCLQLASSLDGASALPPGEFQADGVRV